MTKRQHGNNPVPPRLGPRPSSAKKKGSAKASLQRMTMLRSRKLTAPIWANFENSGLRRKQRRPAIRSSSPSGQGEAMKRNRRLEGPRVRKRSISIGGHKTSISLENEFWQALGEIALVRDLSISKLVATIDEQRQYDNLCSAIRLFVLDFFQNATDELATWRKG